MNETQQKFIELRSQGWTYVRIAQELNVTKRTLITWSRKFRYDIQNQRAMELEAIHAKFLSTREERMQKLGEQLKVVQAELDKRDISELSTPRLFSLAAQIRREIATLAGNTDVATPINEIPADEYHDQIQQWTA